MARDTRRGKTASGGWTAERRRAQSERARRQHEEGKLGGGKKIPKTVAVDANVSGATALQKIIADKKSKPADVIRATRELRLLGVHVPVAEEDIEDEIVTAIEQAVYAPIGIALALGGPVRDRMREWLGEDFTDEDESTIVAHVTDTLKTVTAMPYILAELPLARMLRADFPPLSCIMEARAKSAARAVVLANAPEEEAT